MEEREWSDAMRRIRRQRIDASDNLVIERFKRARTIPYASPPATLPARAAPKVSSPFGVAPYMVRVLAAGLASFLLLGVFYGLLFMNNDSTPTAFVTQYRQPIVIHEQKVVQPVINQTIVVPDGNTERCVVIRDVVNRKTYRECEDV